MELSSLVQGICRMAILWASIFLVLALIGRFLLKPDEEAKGIYTIVIILNVVVLCGSVFMTRFLQHSDESFHSTGKEEKKETHTSIAAFIMKQRENRDK